MSDKILYYPAWISPGRKGDAWSWGKPCDAPGEAAKIVKDEIAVNGATLGIVVKFENGEKTPMMTYIWPMATRKVIAHWEDLWAKTEEAGL